MIKTQKYKILICAVFTVIMCFTLSACAQQQTAVTNIVLSNKVTGIEDSSDGKNAMDILSPVISEENLAQAPLFLSPDKQELYKAAYFLAYQHVVSTGFNPQTTAQPQAITVSEGNVVDMYIDNGFANYEQYIVAMKSVFTDSFMQYMPEEWQFKYAQGENGELYTSAGGTAIRENYVETTFELISETDVEIQFSIINHYSNTLGEDDITSAETYEEKVRASLVNTGNGWRFALFGFGY